MKVQYRNSVVQLSEGSSAKELAEQLNLTEPYQAVAVNINGVPCDLSHLLRDGDEVQFWDFEDKEGSEVFWHTSAHVLAQAVLRLYPEAKPTIGPPIEKGFYYDFDNLHVSEEDFSKIEKEIKKILSENLMPERFEFKNKQEALEAFGSNPYKKELIEAFPEKSLITAYRQGEFFDLCRGPHLGNLGKIKAFKILKTSGAYWRADVKNAMLTRIYGISFPDRQALKDYLRMLEEAKKRDHRTLGSKLDLFSFREESPGMPFIHPKGMVVWESLLEYWRTIHEKNGYEVIKTPQMMSRELWEKSGHWEHYQANMFTCEVADGRTFAIKPMNCPGCMMYYKTRTHSYRELPLKVAEFGHVHRHEPSGALSGLFRVQSFHQDDAHLFMKAGDIKDEIFSVLKLVKEIYETFGLKYTFELSTRPEKSIGTVEDWKVATEGLKAALDAWGQPYKIHEGDGAFYGPKIDLHVHDALGRAWQCGTVQLDLSLPERFALEYKDSDGTLKRPIMIHRAIFGSIERFLGILIEHFAGKFPLWMSPRPVRVLPIATSHVEYGDQVAKQVRAAGFQCEIDRSEESISKKVRNAQLLQVNYILTVGDKECENQTVALRTRDNVVHGEVSLEELIETLLIEKKARRLMSPYQKEEKI